MFDLFAYFMEAFLWQKFKSVDIHCILKKIKFVWTLGFLLRKSQMLPKKRGQRTRVIPLPTSIHPTHYDNELGDYGNDIPLTKKN